MSKSTEPKSNYHYHHEAGSDYFREHIRAFEAAKMQRIVAANASSDAGAAIRRNSASSPFHRENPVEDTQGLLAGQKRAKPHWTTEDRWQKADDGSMLEREGSASGEDVAAHSVEGVDEEEGRHEKSSGRKASDFATTAATGFVPSQTAKAKQVARTSACSKRKESLSVRHQLKTEPRKVERTRKRRKRKEDFGGELLLSRSLLPRVV